MKNNSIFKFTFWKVVAAIIIVLGLYSTYIRFFHGLGASTNLADSVPWGFWIGFDFLGVGLAAAGFTIAVMAHVFNIHKYEPIVRPAILTAYISYMLVVALLVIDLGRPQNFYHPLYMWNIHSVMFEITWCVICYSTILTLEFAPVILEKFNLKAPIKLLRTISIPVVIAGVIFSTLHQSSFGSLYLIVPGKLHGLWYSSLLPVHFFVSCIAAGLSMVIFESYLVARVYGHGLKMNLLSSLGKIVLGAIAFGFVLKAADFIIAGKLPLLFVPSEETFYFYAEIILGTFIPVYLLSNKKFRTSRFWLYITSIFVLSGFVLNRMNVAITGMKASSGVSYFPTIDEINITFMLVIFGMIAYNYVAKKFNVFEDAVHLEKETEENKETEPIILSN